MRGTNQIKKVISIKHSQHMILGIGLIGIGLILICNDYYFFWPPFAAGVLNDDLIGGTFFVVGTLLIHWAIGNRSSVAVNHGLLVLSTGLLAAEATAEFMHGYESGRPHMYMAGWVMLTLLSFTFSIIRKSPKHEDD